MSNQTNSINLDEFSNALHKLFNLYTAQESINKTINDFPLFHNGIIPSDEQAIFLGLCRDAIIFKWYMKSSSDYCPHFINLACPKLLRYPIKYQSEIYDCSICDDCQFLCKDDSLIKSNMKNQEKCLSSLSPALCSLFSSQKTEYFSLDPAITKKITNLHFFPIHSTISSAIQLKNLKELAEYPLFDNLFLNTQYDYMIPVSLITAAYAHCEKTCLNLKAFPINYWDDYYIFSSLASLPSPALKNYIAIKLSNYITETNIHKLITFPSALAPICLSYFPSMESNTVSSVYNFINTPQILTENQDYIHELQMLLSTDSAVITLYNQLLNFEYWLDLIIFSYRFIGDHLVSPENYDYFTLYKKYSCIEEIQQDVFYRFSFLNKNSKIISEYDNKFTHPTLCTLFESYNQKNSSLPNYTKFINTSNSEFNKLQHLLPTLLQIVCSYGQFPSYLYGSPFIFDIVYRKNDKSKP